jgi:ComF family protein
LNNRLNFKQINNTLILQQACLLCAASHGGTHGLCDACNTDLPWQTVMHCPQCGLPNGTNRQRSSVICGRCLKSPPHFMATNALFSYTFPIDAVLQSYKYQHRLPLAHFFATLFLEKLTIDESIDVIIPMPLHPARLKERGFNQALEIARILSKRLNITLDYKSCQRVKNNPPQASLTLKDRVKNMQGVFECTADLSGKTIAIVDDVMTTGASMDALATTLKNVIFRFKTVPA